MDFAASAGSCPLYFKRQSIFLQDTLAISENAVRMTLSMEKTTVSFEEVVHAVREDRKKFLQT